MWPKFGNSSNDRQFGLQLRMIAALAFVSQEDVVNSFDELCVVNPF